MKSSTKRTLRDYCEKSAYACLGMAAYGPRYWAGVALVGALLALVLNEATPKTDH